MANDIIPGAGKSFDIAMIVTFYLLSAYILFSYPPINFIAIITLFIIAVELVDFIVGVAHWAFDQYWSYGHKYMGNLIITFRGHHSNPEKMLAHGVIQSNNNAFPIAVLVLILTLLLVSNSNTAYFLLFVSFIGAYSATVHQWCHKNPQELNIIISELQRYGILISPKQHIKHHDGYQSHYCAITGHFNYILDYLKFWRLLEFVVKKLSGIKPYYQKFN